MILSLIALFVIAGFAQAKEPMIYPAKDQSKEQLEKDKYECYTWSKGQTGFDPMQVPKASEPPPEKEAAKGGVGRGAARGAAVGSLDGEMDEDMHKVGTLDEFSYDVLVTRTDWTPVIGINTILGEHWDITVEGGFGDRTSAMFNLGYRF